MFFHLFRTFCRIGAFTIGGGYAMLPLIREAVVQKEGWVKEDRFLELLTLAQGAPGVMAVNLATLIGLEIAGFPGALCAIAGAILPSFSAILLAASVLTRFFDSPGLAAFFQGATPAVVGIIAATLYQLGKEGLKSVTSLLLALLFLVLLIGLRLHPILIIILALVVIFGWEAVRRKGER